MVATWSTFEQRVRGVATLVWDRPCKPGHVGGLEIEVVVVLAPDAVIYVEMTERRDLNKVREDVNKLTTAKLAATSQGVFARGYCVIEGEPTTAMKEAGQPHYINVVSVAEFERLFFDFDSYQLARNLVPFGSAIDPFTGERDNTAYVPVVYSLDGSSREFRVKDIAQALQEGRRIVLLGEYGSGKSRCVKETFAELARGSSTAFKFPVSIDLRESWGLKKAGEIIRRHFSDLGLEDLQSNAVRASIRNSFIYLFDGFDEIGSQAWSNDDQRLKAIRARSLEGVRDLIGKTQGGVLVAGREHYFPSNEEMFSALGIDRQTALVLRAKTEFTEEEIEEFFEQRSIDVAIPSWLPRRPLICQAVGRMSDAEASAIFGSEGNEAAFWDHFLDVVCSRDAKISAAYDPDVIRQVLISLSRLTRSKPANVGPISLADVQAAFEMAVGKLPVDEAAVMLQRLPGLGRIGTDSVERQFIDTAILDSLRAKDVMAISVSGRDQVLAAGAEQWTNPLGDLGQRVLAQTMRNNEAALVRSCMEASKTSNGTLAGDILSSLMRGSGVGPDLAGIQISHAYISTLDFSQRSARNFSIRSSVLFAVRLSGPGPSGAKVEDCEVAKVEGITSAAALPSWFTDNRVDDFDSAATVSQIRRIGLSPPQEILVAILKKTFFQKGAGRKEEALLRGFGSVAPSGTASRIINLLLREKILRRFRGDDGWVYAPNREHAGRMQRILEELRGSTDDVWVEVSSL